MYTHLQKINLHSIFNDKDSSFFTIFSIDSDYILKLNFFAALFQLNELTIY